MLAVPVDASTSAEPRDVVPSKNSTEPATAGDTVAVNFTESPAVADVGSAVNVVVVAAAAGLATRPSNADCKSDFAASTSACVGAVLSNTVCAAVNFVLNTDHDAAVYSDSTFAFAVSTSDRNALLSTAVTLTATASDVAASYAVASQAVHVAVIE